MSTEQKNICPYCNAPLQENASFCLHCMRSLDEKISVEKVKVKSKRKYVFIAICLSVLLLVAIVLGFALSEKSNQEDMSIDKFVQTANTITDRLGYSKLLYPTEISRIGENPNTGYVTYSVKTNLTGATAYLFVYDDGEKVFSICDVSEEELDDAKKICLCVADTVYESLLDEVHSFIFDDKQYPPYTPDTPYVDGFVKLLGRKDKYDSDIANSVKMKTDYKWSEIDGEALKMDYAVCQRVYEQETIYDVFLDFYND